MKHPFVTLFLMTSAVTTIALAQDGGASGPPKSVIVTEPTVPTTTVPNGSIKKFFQPKSEFVSVK